MWRATFTIRSARFAMFGRTAWGQTRELAEINARDAAEDAGGQVEDLEVREARPGEYEKWLDLERRRAEWSANVRNGRPQPRGLL